MDFATLLALAFAATTLFALRGWARAVMSAGAGDAAVAYASDLQHDAIELYEAAHDMSREPEDDTDAENQYSRLNTAVAEFEATRNRRILAEIERIRGGRQ